MVRLVRRDARLAANDPRIDARQRLLPGLAQQRLAQWRQEHTRNTANNRKVFVTLRTLPVLNVSLGGRLL